MRRSRALPYAAALLVVGALTGCGSSGSTQGATPGSSVSAGGTGSAGSAGSAASQRLEVSVTGSTVTPTPAQVDLAIGETLELVVTSDHDDELHAHGFEAEAELTAGVPTTVRLTGTESGVFEVETHEPALTLLTVAVR